MQYTKLDQSDIAKEMFSDNPHETKDPAETIIAPADRRANPKSLIGACIMESDQQVVSADTGYSRGAPSTATPYPGASGFSVEARICCSKCSTP